MGLIISSYSIHASQSGVLLAVATFVNENLLLFVTAR